MAIKAMIMLSQTKIGHTNGHFKISFTYSTILWELIAFHQSNKITWQRLRV